ncbi:hypothetical protein ACH3Y9_18300 [Streptomyces sp. WSLK1-5]|uniref:hypothetical protein n=1 Tax=unclassified Streptomyces TaxID=2593676 RepID=UPI0037B4AB4A
MPAPTDKPPTGRRQGSTGHRQTRRAERAEERRQQIAVSQARRAECLALLERFIEVSAEAERAAYSRPADHEHTDPWFLTTSEAMNRLWVAERLVRVQFPLPVHQAARAHFLDLNRTVWEGLPEGESVRDHLEANRPAFLDAARETLE